MTIRINKKLPLGSFFSPSKRRGAARQSLHVPPSAAHTRTCGNACAKHYHDRYALPLPDHAMHCQLYGNLSASLLMVQPSTASGRRLHPIKPVNLHTGDISLSGDAFPISFSHQALNSAYGRSPCGVRLAVCFANLNHATRVFAVPVLILNAPCGYAPSRVASW